MTDQQYEKFVGLIKALNKAYWPKRKIFNKQIVYVKITDSLGEAINFKLRKASNVSEKGLRMLIGNRLKDLEKVGKRLDLDNKCNISLQVKNKTSYKKVAKKPHNKNVKNYKNKVR